MEWNANSQNTQHHVRVCMQTSKLPVCLIVIYLIELPHSIMLLSIDIRQCEFNYQKIIDMEIKFWEAIKSIEMQLEKLAGGQMGDKELN